MPRIDDYQCPCGNRFEYMRMTSDEVVHCLSCGGAGAIAAVGAKLVEIIVPMHRKSLTQKAGFVHSHGDRPAERGYVSVPANKGSF